MPRYKIEQRIKTLAENAVNAASHKPSFEVDEIVFTHWEYNLRDGWLEDAWVAEYMCEAPSYEKAYIELRSKLFNIIPRIALVGQCFIEYTVEPFLITRVDKDFGFTYHVREDQPVGLMFMEEQKRALDILVAGASIPNEFFLYWNDAVNTTGYTSKLLLMFAALFALTKKVNGDNDYDFIERILGTELKDKIFAPRTGLRHRLSHGEYLTNESDTAEDYIDMVHKRVIKYFNDEIFKEKLISEDTVHPQRNFTHNHSAGAFFIQPRNAAPLELRPIVQEFSLQEDLSLPNYDFLHGSVTDAF